jgi:glucosamine--fructose-6-phosphate aminotransferase (isomerizing)
MNAAHDPAVPQAEPGALFLSEIREQPAALLRLLDHEQEYATVARAAEERAPSAIRLVGHGSSDNAASYGVYALGLLPGWTAMRDSISLTVYYKAKLDLASSIVVALSQSGRTPDVVSYVERARAQGAFTVAVTNDPTSELGGAAEAILPLGAGDERAVAATKTYLNQLAALVLFAGFAAGRGLEIAEGIRRTAGLLDDALDGLERAVAPVAAAFAYVGRMYVIGRGIEFATAREVALKLTEACRIAAEPLTSTDLAHGPVAALDAMFPVWTIASRDESLPTLVEAASRAREAGATLVASGSAASEIAGAAHKLPVPEAPLAVLSPLLSVVPGQLFSLAVARAKGLDPDRPEHLTKVTLAQ